MKNEDFIYKKENTIKVLTLDEIKKEEAIACVMDGFNIRCVYVHRIYL